MCISFDMAGVCFYRFIYRPFFSPPAVVNHCPDSTDCARAGRQYCKPGSSHCGPCIPSLQEDEEGHCVAPGSHHFHYSKQPSETQNTIISEFYPNNPDARVKSRVRLIVFCKLTLLALMSWLAGTLGTHSVD